MAVEKIGPISPAFLGAHPGINNGNEIFDLRISRFGPELLAELQNMTFEGLSGEFHLINGQLNTSTLEIFNIYETERPIGYWTPDGGITRKLSSNGRQTYSTSTKELKKILWPGDSTKKPIGWAIPSMKLRVGVPKKEGFTEFIDVSQDPLTYKTTNVTGYSIDIFCSVIKRLPFHIKPEFYAFTNKSGFSNGTYDDLLYAIPNETYDMVVGDVTILADRAKYVDFTLPYSEAGTVMVVRNRKQRDIWIFVKPFSWDLWLLIFGTCICIGVVLRILENRANCQSDFIGLKKHNLGFSFPIASLAFPERDLVLNKWSRFVMVVWLLMAFILMQSYTANLSAMFTVDQLDYRFSSDECIGVQKDSFVRNFLKKRLNISDKKIRDYSTIEEYHEAMRIGSKNGGIDAIFDEIPYMKLFLDQYGSEYKIVGHTYKTDGFGFAFPSGSPLAAYFSRAILDFTENGNFTEIQEKYFGPSHSSDPINSISSETPELRFYDFGGLFIIIGSAMLLALFCSETTVGQRLTDAVADYSKKSFFFLPSRENDSRIDSTVHPEGGNGDSSSDEEHQGSDNIDQESAQGDSNHLAGADQVTESVQGNTKNEIQLSEHRNANVTEEKPNQ
ncbi:OLC1v1035389C3 [Oldenlandia corymbosa var. corymbosa]|nr:OLC1v1035389C3 [Oldenlandia corymbosa var. corymbosa]